MKRNKFNKALKHLKSKELDKKIKDLDEAAPTNSMSGVYQVSPSSGDAFRLGPLDPPKRFYPKADGSWPAGIPGDPNKIHYDRPAGYWNSGRNTVQPVGTPTQRDYSYADVQAKGKTDTTTLIRASDGKPYTAIPPNSESFILGPVCTSYAINHGYDDYTNLGYIQKDTRQFVLLARIQGHFRGEDKPRTSYLNHGSFGRTWDGSAGDLTIYNSNFTLEMAQWMKDTYLAGNYKADFPFNFSGGIPVERSPDDNSMGEGDILGTDDGQQSDDDDTDGQEQDDADENDLESLELWDKRYDEENPKPKRSDFGPGRDGRAAYERAKREWERKKKEAMKAEMDRRSAEAEAAKNAETEKRYDEAPWRRDEERRAREHGLSEKRAGEMSQDELDRFLDQQDKLQADIDKHSADQKKYEDEANKILRDFGVDVALTLLGPGLLKLGLKGLSLSARAALKAAKAAKAASAKRKLDAAAKAIAAKKKLDKARAAEEARKLLAKTERARKAAEAAKKAEKVAKANKKVNNIGDKLKEKAKEKFDDIKRYIDKGKYDQLPDEDTASFTKLLKNDIDQMGKFIKKSSRNKPFKDLTKADFEGGPIPTNIDQLIQFMQGKGGLTWSFSRGGGTGPTPLFRQTPRLIKQVFKPSTKTKIRHIKTPKVDVKYKPSKPKYDLSKEVEKAIKKNKYTTTDEPTRLNPKKRFPVGEENVVSEEDKIRILREIRQPLKEIQELPKTQKLKGYRPNFKGKFSPQNTPDVTASKESDEAVHGYNTSRLAWTSKDKYWKGYETAERMNVIFDRVGFGDQYFDQVVAENILGNKNKARKMQEHLNQLAHEKALREVYGVTESPFRNIEESETYDNKVKDPLFTKVASRLKKEIDYPKKPSPKGYPNEAPPKIDPNTGMHPKYGKRYKYDKLDPQSAEAMPMQGDPEIDANIQRLSDKKVKARKLKNLMGKK